MAVGSMRARTAPHESSPSRACHDHSFLGNEQDFRRNCLKKRLTWQGWGGRRRLQQVAGLSGMFRRCAALGWCMICGEDAKGRMERACDRIRPSLSGVPIRDSLSGMFLDCRGHIRRERLSTNSMRISPKSSKCCLRMGSLPWNQNSSERRRFRWAERWPSGNSRSSSRQKS